MRPNARTIQKVLMKHRSNSFWGRRAFITVRIPLDLLPPPPCEAPKPEGVGWKENFVGDWVRELPFAQLPPEERAEFYDVPEDGILWEAWSISKVICGDDPRKDWVEHSIEDRHVIFDRGEPYTFRAGETHTPCTWWSGEYFSNVRSPEVEFDSTKNEAFRIDPEIIDRYIARYEWEEKYIDGMQETTGIEVLDAFHDAAGWAKTTYHKITDRYVYLTYSVKWFYPKHKRRFCADLARAFRVATKNGVNVKLLRGLS